MKKMRMCFPNEKTFSDGFAEYILDCKARNLRDGSINHYQESIKQIYKRIPPKTPISSFDKQTMVDFYIVIIVRTLVFGDPTAGWPSLVCIMLLLSGIQMLCIGIVGQYLAKTYLETKKRPIYLVGETNLEKQ